MFRKQILILEDDDKYANELRNSLEGVYDVFLTKDLSEFWKIFQPFTFDLVILDIRISDKDQGFFVLKELKEKFSEQAVVILTQYGESEYFFKAMDLGAHLFLEKQDYSTKVIAKLINSLVLYLDVEKKAKRLEKQIVNLYPLDIVGENQAIKKIKQEIQMAGVDGDITVLIRGESGTGKELVARNIHRLGRRKEFNFIPLNISGLPRDLLYSELFGYEKGAFTDAKNVKKGLLEEANGGVFFLDEIGDLEEEGQIKLLRVLEEKSFMRLGGLKQIKIDIQFVTATNKNLEDLVQKEKFRQDLYYRLRQFEIYIPPLRERKEDIPFLAQHFLKMLEKEGKTKVNSISTQVMQLFKNYNWPGNVRELKVAIENATIRADWENSSVIKISHLPGFLLSSESQIIPKERNWDYTFSIAKAEIQFIASAIEEFGIKQKTKLAKLLHYKNRFTLMRRIRKHFLRFPELKDTFPSIWEMFIGGKNV